MSQMSQMNADTKQPDGRIPNICVNLRNLAAKNPTGLRMSDELQRGARGMNPETQDRLPSGWLGTNLGELIDMIMGQAPAGTDCNKSGVGTIFVKAGEFGPHHPVVREWTTKPLRLAQQGDIFLCVVGATAGKINYGINCAIGRSVAALRPAGAIDREFLYHFLSTKVLSLRNGSNGSAQGVISKPDISAIAIFLPPLPEQRRIVAKIEELFSELDEGIENLKQARAQLTVYRQALLKHAFEGKLTADWRAAHADKPGSNSHPK